MGAGFFFFRSVRPSGPTLAFVRPAGLSGGSGWAGKDKRAPGGIRRADSRSRTTRRIVRRVWLGGQGQTRSGRESSSPLS